jgi:hypothetical protein
MAFLFCSSAYLFFASASPAQRPLHPCQLLLVLLCVRLGTLYALVPLLTIVGFLTVIIFQ